MKISIALTTFNGGGRLREQLDSYRNQDRTPDELVVCDDGSTDETLSILDEFKRNVPFVVIVIRNKHNLGYTKNFEKAMTHCSGDLIFLSDQDDLWFSNKISVMEKAFEANPDKLLIIHDGELVDENLVSNGVTKLGQVIAGYGSDDSHITGALTAIRQEFLPYALPIPSGIVGHDRWMHAVARMIGMRMVIEETLELIVRHSSNTSAWIASSLEPINKFAVIRSQLSTTPATTYQDRLVENDNLAERLRMVDSSPDCKVSANLIMEGYDFLKAERRAIINREKAIQRSFFLRKVSAFGILIRGEYVHFNGMKSFLRDVIR